MSAVNHVSFSQRAQKEYDASGAVKKQAVDAIIKHLEEGKYPFILTPLDSAKKLHRVRTTVLIKNNIMILIDYRKSHTQLSDHMRLNFTLLLEIDNNLIVIDSIKDYVMEVGHHFNSGIL